MDPGRARRDTELMGHRLACPGFVGRDGEVALLRAAFDIVVNGRAATVLVGGDAGIGKTRLVDELCRQARERGAVVARGACVPVDGGGLPCAPVVGVLRDLVRQVDDPAAAEALRPLVTGITTAVPGAADPGVVYPAIPPATDDLARTRSFEAILACFTTLAERAPLVLVFEDLQWADSVSADLLTYLTRNLVETSVLLIGTYRSEEIGPGHHLRPWLTELGRHAHVTQLRLEGLGKDETAELIAGILGETPDWALVDAVWARSQGNPFFAEELTAARHSPSLSPELRGVIMTRVEARSAEAQQVLRIVATAPGGVAHRLLATTTDLDPDALDRALSESVDSQILVVDPEQSTYRFRHALLHEAVHDAILPGERVRLHRRMAQVLTEDPSTGPVQPGHLAAELATHWWAAGEWAEALDTSKVAADAALALWAFPEALAHLERALAALDRLPPSPTSTTDRHQLLEHAADAAYLAGDGQRSVELARAAVDEVDAVADPATAARYLSLLGRNAWTVGDSDAAFDAYRRAGDLVPAHPPTAGLARILAEEARGLMLMSRHAEAEVRCREAIAIAQEVGARAEEGHARCTLGCSRASRGHVDEGIDLVREALAIAEDIASPEDLNRAYGNLSSLLLDSGRLQEAAQMVFDGAAVGEDLWGVVLDGAAGNSAAALVRLGRFDDATVLLAQLGDHSLGPCAPAPYLLPAPMAIRCGRFDEAGRLLATADTMTVGLADVQQRGSFHLLAAELALEEGRPDDAGEEVERALALVVGTDDETYAPEMCMLGVRALADRFEAARAHGRPFDVDKARLLALALVQDADRLVAAPVERGGSCPPRPLALAATCTAEQSRLHGSDPELWEAAAVRWDTAGEPYGVAYCRWREAEALLDARAGRGHAGPSLQDAWRLSRDLGTAPLTERIERLARRARIPLREPDPADAAAGTTLAADLGLTPREVEVLGQLAAGRTDREIAESLFISKKTASVHVSNLLRKLDVANRVEAGKVGQAHHLG